MTDYQQIVDEIRFALQSEDCELTEDLRQASSVYAAACQEVNQQLRKIASYLDGGLRSEAIQLAEGPPNLLDIIRILNFPEVKEWADVVALYDLPRSEPILRDVVDKLNEALVVDQPLQKLMSRHRLLALVRAPLRIRLGVLRELMEADPETPWWEEDVREFERARFQEVALAARDAIRAGSLDQLRQLQSDFHGVKWLEKPPQKLVTSVRAGVAELTSKLARREVDELATSLESAFSELDLPLARQLRPRWQEAFQQSGLTPNDPVVQQVAPILGWLQDEDAREAMERRYQQSIREFESALNSEAPLEDLERRLHEIRRLDRDLPELLSTRYISRRDSLLLAKTRVHRLKIGSAVIGALLLIGLVSVLVHHQRRSSSMARTAGHVESLLSNKQFEEARNVLQQRGDVADWDRLIALQARLDREQGEDQERSQRLQTELQKARDASSHAEAQVALARAKTYLTRADEELEFNRVQQDWEKRHQQDLAEREKKIQQGIQRVTADLVKVEQEMGTGTGREELGAILSAAAESLAQLQAGTFGLRPELASQLKLLASRQSELEGLRNQRLLRDRRQQELTRAALIPSGQSNPDGAVLQLRKALLAYADTLQQESVVSALRASADEDAYWRSAFAWSQMANPWTDVWPEDPSVVANRAAAIQEFLKRDSGAPDARMASRYLDQFRALQARDGHGNETENNLKERFLRIYSNPLIASSWCFRTKDGRVYYSPEKRRLPSGKLLTFRYFTGYGKEEVAVQNRVHEEDLTSLESVTSPSSAIAAQVVGKLSNLRPEEWNDFCRDVALLLLATEDLNPFLKMDLLRRDLEAAAEGDVFLRDELAAHLKLLQDASINPLAQWMNPDDKEGKRASEAAAEILAKFLRLSPLDAVWKNADVARTEFAAGLRRPVMIVGWLNQQEGHWRCQTEWKPDRDYELRVVVLNEDKSASQWRNVGEVSGGKLLMRSEVNSFLSPGRAVFAVPREARAVVRR
ncbi:hypothetical protein [Planctomicrobium sp. SH664]|uniref:hypothetical protein n=1 Tax=Planctomicrobium sp. SH664 TaxID=3448125 RepID=UPI003F5B1ACB